MTRWIRSPAVRALLLAASSSVWLPCRVAAQEAEASSWTFSVAGELVSRFIWRGLELHDKPSLQPEALLEYGSLSFGLWTSLPLGGSYKEVDIYVSWYRQFSAGELTVTGTDYFYPGQPGDFGDFFNYGGVVDGEATGAHTIELGAEFTPSVAPVTFMLAWNAYNDPDRSLFGQVSGDVSLPLFDLTGEFGFLLNDSPDYYGAGAWHATNYTVRASRSFPLGSLEPHVSVALIRSAIMDEYYWVFAVGL